MTKRTIASLSAIAVAFALAGCAGDVANNGTGTGLTISNGQSSAGAMASGALGIADALRVHGLEVTMASQDASVAAIFPEGTAYAISVNGQPVQAYEYPSEQMAQADAGAISPDGGTVGNVKISWVGQPHFYRKGSVLLLYLGNNPAILDALDDVAGPQFAGVSQNPAVGTGATL